jgi:hypothetical protein
VVVGFVLFKSSPKLGIFNPEGKVERIKAIINNPIMHIAR